MKIDITFRHLEPTEALKGFVNEKLKKIEKYILKPIDIHVILSTEKYLHKAEINVQDTHLSAHAEEECEDMYASIEKAVAKVGKVLKKHKDKVKNTKATATPQSN